MSLVAAAAVREKAEVKVEKKSADSANGWGFGLGGKVAEKDDKPPPPPPLLAEKKKEPAATPPLAPTAKEEDDTKAPDAKKCGDYGFGSGFGNAFESDPKLEPAAKKEANPFNSTNTGEVWFFPRSKATILPCESRSGELKVKSNAVQ